MNRQQLRKGLRDTEKEIKKTKNLKPYKEIIDGNIFDGFSKTEMDLLREGKHPKKALQLKYEMGIAYINTITTLEGKRDILKAQLVHKKDASLVEE